MTQYSYAQLEDLWIGAGGKSSMAPLMAAIAEAESSGNSEAYNASGATGLWQILGAVNSSDQGSLTNPQVNAKEAVLKYNSQGLGAWTTYTSGAYKQFLQSGTAPTSVTTQLDNQSVTTDAGSTSTSSSTTTDITPSSLTSLLAPIRQLLHGVATVIDYSFTMFEPGQGLRAVFALVAVVMAFFSYKILAGAGVAPRMRVI